MSETLEERLRDRAKKDPDYLITAYALDVIEVIDGLRAENAKLVAEKGDAWYDSLSMGTRIAELESENAKLRDAMKRLVKDRDDGYLPDVVVVTDEDWDIVRKALEESETK